LELLSFRNRFDPYNGRDKIQRSWVIVRSNVEDVAMANSRIGIFSSSKLVAEVARLRAILPRKARALASSATELQRNLELLILLAALAVVFLPTTAVGYTLLYSLDFDNLPLGPPVDEQVVGFPNAFTHTPPGGWTRDNSNFPEPFNPLFGVFEWKGWSFANSGFWQASEKSNDFPGRSAFGNGSGTIAVADSDLWNDKADPANGIGFFNSTLRTQPISITQPISLNEQISVGFDTSWRGECCDDGAGFNPNGNNQTFVVEAIYNNSIVQEVLRWESAPFRDPMGKPSTNPAHAPNPFFKANSSNELVVIDLDPPPGSATLRMSWRLQNAGEDGWLAIDNVVVSTVCGATKGDMNLDCMPNTGDIADWVLGLRNPQGYFDKYPPNFPERRGSQNGFKLDFDEAEWFLEQINAGGGNATMADLLAALNAKVPEPAAVGLLIQGMVLTSLLARRRL
jgi:hypothetical protein